MVTEYHGKCLRKVESVLLETNLEYLLLHLMFMFTFEKSNQKGEGGGGVNFHPNSF